MQPILDFIANNPELTVTIFALVESVVMPFIPVKWNGIAAFILKYAKSKLVKPVDNSAKAKMEKAVNDFSKESAEDKLRG